MANTTQRRANQPIRKEAAGLDEQKSELIGQNSHSADQPLLRHASVKDERLREISQPNITQWPIQRRDTPINQLERRPPGRMNDTIESIEARKRKESEVTKAVKSKRMTKRLNLKMKT
jgi:hypothetical protein